MSTPAKSAPASFAPTLCGGQTSQSYSVDAGEAGTCHFCSCNIQLPCEVQRRAKADFGARVHPNLPPKRVAVTGIALAAAAAALFRRSQGRWRSGQIAAWRNCYFSARREGSGPRRRRAIGTCGKSRASSGRRAFGPTERGTCCRREILTRIYSADHGEDLMRHRSHPRNLLPRSRKFPWPSQPKSCRRKWSLKNRRPWRRIWPRRLPRFLPLLF